MRRRAGRSRSTDRSCGSSSPRRAVIRAPNDLRTRRSASGSPHRAAGAVLRRAREARRVEDLRRRPSRLASSRCFSPRDSSRSRWRPSWSPPAAPMTVRPLPRGSASATPSTCDLAEIADLLERDLGRRSPLADRRVRRAARPARRRLPCARRHGRRPDRLGRVGRHAPRHALRRRSGAARRIRDFRRRGIYRALVSARAAIARDRGYPFAAGRRLVDEPPRARRARVRRSSPRRRRMSGRPDTRHRRPCHDGRMLVALTGGIASGKSDSSPAASRARRRRRGRRPGRSRGRRTGNRRARRDRRGSSAPACIAADGSLDRAALGAIIFARRRRRGRRSTPITHPAVGERPRELFAAARDADPDGVVVYDVPLLVTSGGEGRRLEFDRSSWWASRRRDPLHRLVELRGMTARGGARTGSTSQATPSRAARHRRRT